MAESEEEFWKRINDQLEEIERKVDWLIDNIRVTGLGAKYSIRDIIDVRKFNEKKH